MFHGNINLRLIFGRRVKVDNTMLDRICELMSKLDLSKQKPFDWRDKKHWPDDIEGVSTVSQFFTVGNAINFRYWWLDEEGKYNYCQGKKGGNFENGAYYMWRSLKLCLENEMFPILNPDELMRITLSEVRQIFQDDEGQDVMPALRERQKNWRDLGLKLNEFWNGNFYNLIQKINGSLFNFMQYSRQFRAFDDPLCKMTMVNAIMHKGRGLIKFDAPIFPGIDYQLLKQQMRMGVLILKRGMEEKIKKSNLLTPTEARELRNAGLYALLYIMEKTSIEGDIIDNIWWMNRKICDTETPSCERCLFNKVCLKKIEFGIPLEITRYY